jgi:hypothetical protein
VREPLTGSRAGTAPAGRPASQRQAGISGSSVISRNNTPTGFAIPRTTATKSVFSSQCPGLFWPAKTVIVDLEDLILAFYLNHKPVQLASIDLR